MCMHALLLQTLSLFPDTILWNDIYLGMMTSDQVCGHQQAGCLTPLAVIPFDKDSLQAALVRTMTRLQHAKYYAPHTPEFALSMTDLNGSSHTFPNGLQSG